MKYSHKFLGRMRFLLLLLCFILCFQSTVLPVFATSEELNAEAEERKNNPVESNDIEGWPDGPLIGADSAILMDADSGVILYAKNIDAREFPASTTKIMTSLVAIENSSLDEIVTVNQSAIDANASDGSNMGLNAGEQLTMEQILYGVLINSANEGCNAIGEHIAGSMSAYVDMMNARAQEIGCTNTHFVTTNGLHDEEHYTSARDLALIAREFFKHDILCKMASTPRYVIDATDQHLEHYLNSHNKLYEGGDYEYSYLIGSKTGFTSHSRQCLVSCAEKNGVRLICVVMKEESPYQFEDTVNLFEYGFSNFSKVNIASNENRFEIGQAEFFNSSSDLYGSTANLILLDKEASLILPKGINFEDLETTITYDNSSPDIIGTIEYSYHSMYLGEVNLLHNPNAVSKYQFSTGDLESSANSENSDIDSTDGGINSSEKKPVIIDVRKLLVTIFIIIVVLVAGAFIYSRIRLANSKRRRHYRRVPAEKKTRNYEASDGKQIKPRRSVEMESITRPKKPVKKSNPIGDKILKFFEYLSGFSEAQRVEDAKKERYEREEQRLERLREEIETRRIEGQSSIRSRARRRISEDYNDDYEEDYVSRNNRRTKRVDYDDVEETNNIRSFDAASKKRKSSQNSRSGSNRQHTRKTTSRGYTQEEEELLARQERRRQLAERRKRNENSDN